MVAFIHDEVVVEIPTEQAEELLPQIEQALKEAGQYYLPNVEISLSANICDSWIYVIHGWKNQLNSERISPVPHV